jgi:hypothetical protein
MDGSSLPESRADRAQETFRLFALYDAEGPELEDRRIIDTIDEVSFIAGKMRVLGSPAAASVRAVRLPITSSLVDIATRCLLYVQRGALLTDD